MGEHIMVDTKDSDVNCPDCGERMRKKNSPLHPWPRQHQGVEVVTQYLGVAHCDSCQNGPRLWGMMS